MKRAGRAIVYFLFVFLISASVSAAQVEKPLIASLAFIPGLIDSPEKGPFVDLVKAMGHDTGREVKIDVFPFARSIDNVVKGRADFHVPVIRNRAIDESKLPYAFTTEKFGTVSFVIYSNTKKSLTKEKILQAKEKEKFPYIVEVPANMEGLFPFPCQSSNDVSLSLQKVQRGRIDALVWAQEEVDLAIRKIKPNEIHREHWADMEDSIIIAKGPQGKEMDAVLSKALRKLRASGKLESLYEKVHKPYDNWQPASMGW